MSIDRSGAEAAGGDRIANQKERRMYDVLRDRIWRNLEALPEEKLYQVLDYIEFLSSKYSREPVRPGTPFQKFGERLEDKLRGNRIGLDAIRSTLGVVGTADRMVSGLTEAGRSLIREVGGTVIPPDGTRTPLAPPRDVSAPAPPRREDIRIDE
jgi:hypothetical protein